MKKLICAAAFALGAALPAWSQVKWDLPAAYPANNFHTENLVQFANDVDKATGGKLKITVHANASLFKAPEIKRAVQGGQAQIGEILLANFSNEWPIYAADGLPFLADSYDEGMKLYKAQKPLMDKKLAEQGMMLFQQDEKPHHIPTRAREVYDVSGAGDTAIALLTLALDPAVAVVVSFRIDDDPDLAVGVGPHGEDVTDRRRCLQQTDLGLDHLKIERVVGGRRRGEAAVAHLLHDEGEGGCDRAHLVGYLPLGSVADEIGGPPASEEQQGAGGPATAGPPPAAPGLVPPGELHVWAYPAPDHVNLVLDAPGRREVLRVALLALRDGPRVLPGRDRAAGALGVVLVALLPAVIALSAAKTFLVADSFLWRLHSQYIAEFQGLDRILRRGFNWVLAGLWLPMLLLGPALWRTLRRSTSATERASLAFVLAPALLAWFMGWNQVRWLSLAFALTVPVLAVFFRTDEAARTRKIFLGWLAAGLLLFSSGLVKAVQRTLEAPEFTTEDIRSLAERDVAHWLRLRGGAGRVVVAATPSVTNKLIYHGGVTGVDTLYWENLAGLKRAAELFAAPTPEAAREIAGRLGITHIAFLSWGAFEGTLVRLQRGLPEDAPLPADTFVARLFGAPVPPSWLRAVPFKLPKHPAVHNSGRVALKKHCDFFKKNFMNELYGFTVARCDAHLIKPVLKT